SAWSSLRGIWVLEEFVDLAEPRTPQVLELRQKITRPGKLFRVPTDPAFTAVRSFDHETCLLQYRHVLLHRCKRHVVARGEGRHRRLLPCKYAPDDVAARGVGECAEQAVELRVGLVSMTYNRMVVGNGTRPRRQVGRDATGGRQARNSRAPAQFPADCGDVRAVTAFVDVSPALPRAVERG